MISVSAGGVSLLVPSRRKQQMQQRTIPVRFVSQTDTTVFLQTAQSVIWDAAHPERMARARAELDEKRTQVIQSFLAAQTAGRGSLCFQVVVHDPAEVGVAATWVWSR